MAKPIQFYSKTVTATADGAFQVDDTNDIVLTSVNIHCYTNDCYYGNLGVQAGILRANAVIWFDAPIRISDLWFKNFTAGQNTVIVITGTIPMG